MNVYILILECAQRFAARPALGFVMVVIAFGWSMPLQADDQQTLPTTELHPSTPHEFVALFEAATASMSAEAVASLNSDVSVSIPFKGEIGTMEGRAQQRAGLMAIFSGLKERGVTSLRVADYTVTQISNEFAFARLRWELSDSTATLKSTGMTTYVIRREEAGWRIVAILEMGAPQGPLEH